MTTTVERLNTEDKDRVALHFKHGTGGRFINFSADEWDLLLATVHDHGTVPFEELDDDYPEEAEPDDVDMLIAEMEQQLMQDDLRERLWDTEAILSQERARVRQLLNIVEELVMR